jgi:hypothetical protein
MIFVGNAGVGMKDTVMQVGRDLQHELSFPCFFFFLLLLHRFQASFSTNSVPKASLMKKHQINSGRVTSVTPSHIFTQGVAHIGTILNEASDGILYIGNVAAFLTEQSGHHYLDLLLDEVEVIHFQGKKKMKKKC